MRKRTFNKLIYGFLYPDLNMESLITPFYLLPSIKAKLEIMMKFKHKHRKHVFPFIKYHQMGVVFTWIFINELFSTPFQ